MAMRTMWIGKIIGGIFGLMLAGPVGLLVGIFIGHQFDKAYKNQFRGHHHQTAVQQAFFTATFQVMGHLAKADGRVSEDEIRTARAVMQRMGLNEQQRKLAIELFTQGKQPGFDLHQALQALMETCHQYRPLLQMFVEIQLQAALADGQLTGAKKAILKKICEQLGFPLPGIFFFEDLFGGQQHSHYQRRPASSSPRSSLNDAYQELGVQREATNAEVKRAYRRLMSQHHPDKLVAKGLPEEMMKMATQKTQKIQLAYDQICTARGM